MKNNTQEKRNTRLLAFMAFYSIAMIFILMFSIFIINEKSAQDPVTKYVIETEYVYIAETVRQPETDPNEDTVEAAESVFETLIIKEYGSKIGIFNVDGELIHHIDVYTKTLPEADRHLLEEGFEITSEKQLAAIIQDYSS